MEDDKKVVENLEQVFAAGDAWLRRYGIVSPIAHNSIVLNLYSAFPKARYIDYFLPRDMTQRKVWVRLHVPFWKLLFCNRDRLIDNVIDFLREYLHEYDIQVELKRYKRGVERSDEIPQVVTEHLGAVPVPEPVAPASGEPGPGAGGDAEADQPDQPVDPQAGAILDGEGGAADS